MQVSVRRVRYCEAGLRACMAMVLLLVFQFASGPAAARTFTGKNGKTIEAELVGVSDTHVMLQANGQTFKVAIANLSEVDQIYVRDQRKESRERAERERLLEEVRSGAHGHHTPAKAKPGEGTVDDSNNDFVDAGGGAGEAASKPKAEAKPAEPAAKPAAPAAPADPTLPGKPGKVTEVKVDKEGNAFSYMLFVPPGFSKERKWPFMLAVSPGGHHARDEIRAYVKGAERNNFIVVMPVYPQESKLETADIDKLVLAAAREALPIDEDRFYVSGFSSGADRAMRLATETSKLKCAGVLSCDAGLQQNRVQLDKNTIFYAICGAGSRRRYEVAYTFNKLLKGNDHVLKMIMASNAWPGEEDIADGITWLNACALHKVSAQDKALLADKTALAKGLLEQLAAEKDTNPEHAYELGLMLQNVAGDMGPAAQGMAVALREISQNPALKKYMDARKDFDRFVRKYIGDSPSAPQREDKGAKRSGERLAEEYKETSLGPLFSRLGDPPL